MTGAETRPSRQRGANFFTGFSSIFSGLATLARTPALWPWALVPAALLAALETLFVALAVLLIRPWATAKLEPMTTSFGRFGVDAAGWLAAIVTGVVGWFIAVALAPPLSAPALERIVLCVEAELGVPARAPLGFLRELACGFRATLGAAVLCGPLVLGLWFVEVLLPPAAVVTVPAHVIVSSLGVALALFDYPLTLRGVPFRERLRLVLGNFGCVLGFGLAFTLAFWIPCCGVLLLPIGAAAATRVVWLIETRA